MTGRGVRMGNEGRREGLSGRKFRISCECSKVVVKNRRTSAKPTQGTAEALDSFKLFSVIQFLPHREHSPFCPKKIIVYEYTVWAKCGVFVLNLLVHRVTAGF